MCNFPDTFFRGCPHRNFIKPSAKPFPASPKAFQPNSRAENQNNQAETSIVWNDDAESLPFFIRMETHKEDDGLIKYGIIPVDFIKAESSIRESAFAPYISFNHDSDAQNQNPYHGNICFSLSFFFTANEKITEYRIRDCLTKRANTSSIPNVVSSPPIGSKISCRKASLSCLNAFHLNSNGESEKGDLNE